MSTPSPKHNHPGAFSLPLTMTTAVAPGGIGPPVDTRTAHPGCMAAKSGELPACMQVKGQ
jgi:hypothetical protein